MKKLNRIPTLEDIRATHGGIRPLIHRTPALTSRSINEKAGAELFFKCENFQKVGAFKMRGASSAALRLTQEELEKGLATHSSGNHAQAVARCAQALGAPAFIVMPETAPQIKVAATKGYGAEIIFCPNTLKDRESTLEAVVERTGAAFIHPYDDYNVIAGQATAAMELIEDTAGLDVVMAPIGGGGLMSGTALATKALLPKARIYGAEPEIVDDACRSFKSGRLQFNNRIDTIADGLRTNLSEKTFEIISTSLDDIFTVSEEAIIAAMRLIWERMKIVVEPSGAVPLAAVLSHPGPFRGKRIGVILSGGNVDLGKLPF